MLRRVIQHVALLAIVALLVGAGPLMHRRLHFRAAAGDDAVVHYTCDEGSGTTLVDSGSKGLDATHDADYAAGHVGDYCLLLNGTSDNGYTASTDLAANWEAISIAFWWYLDEYRDQVVLDLSPATADQRRFLVQAAGNYLRTTLYGASSAEAQSYCAWTVLGTLTWRHVVCLWDKSVDSGKVKMYIDNAEVSYVQQQTLVQALRSDSGVMYIGQRYNATSFLKGRLDDIRIYNYAIDSTKRAELFAMGPPTYTVTDSWDADFNGVYTRSAAPGYKTDDAYTLTLGGAVYYWTKDGNTRWIAINSSGSAWVIFSVAEELIDSKTFAGTTPPTGTYDFGAVVTEN